MVRSHSERPVDSRSRSVSEPKFKLVASQSGATSPKSGTHKAHAESPVKSAQRFEHSRQSTASTQADSDISSSQSSLVIMTRSASASRRVSLQVASAGTTAKYVEKAEQILQDADGGLDLVCSSAGFSDALARQGLELVELSSKSELSFPRRVQLLAAVLREQADKAITAPTATPSPCHARTLQQQLMRRISEEEERSTRHHDQREQVLQSHFSLLTARDTKNRQKILDDEDRDCRAQARMNESKIAKQRSLGERFQSVQAAVQNHHRDVKIKSLQRQEEQQKKSDRSANHLGDRRVSAEQERQQRRASSMERGHQVHRVARIQQFYRVQQEKHHKEDSVIFAECQQLKVDACASRKLACASPC